MGGGVVGWWWKEWNISWLLRYVAFPWLSNKLSLLLLFLKKQYLDPPNYEKLKSSWMQKILPYLGGSRISTFVILVNVIPGSTPQNKITWWLLQLYLWDMLWGNSLPCFLPYNSIFLWLQGGLGHPETVEKELYKMQLFLNGKPKVIKMLDHTLFTHF